MTVVLKKVSKIYRTGQAVTVALDEVSLEARRGEIIVLMGPSGSGKTTLLNIVGTLDKPTSGEVYVLGRDVVNTPERELEKFRLRNVGFLFQTYNLVPYLTAEMNVALPLMALGVKKELALLRARILLDMVGLGEYVKMYPHQLSGGMQQRVAFARAIAVNPPVLILDEPTSNVDLDNASVILSLIAAVTKASESVTFISTHDPDVLSIASRVVYMRGGRAYESSEQPKRRVEIDFEKIATAYEKLKLLDSTLGG